MELLNEKSKREMKGKMGWEVRPQQKGGKEVLWVVSFGILMGRHEKGQESVLGCRVAISSS